mmetsp:Transcript_8396/g.18410  ORF Transcript_8396/g.18410 Transcript_8396/m.18410 type:complete len:276 (+) Transcript_8396:134-961(+)
MDVKDSLCKQWGNAELRQLLISSTLRCGRYSVQYDTFLHTRVGNPVVSRPAEKSVTGKSKDTFGSLLRKNVGGLAESSRRIDHIVHDDAIAAFHVSHKIHFIDGTGPGALFDDHGQTHVVHVEFVREPLLKFLGAIDASGVRTDDDGVVQVLVSEVVDADDSAVQVVHRNARAEESLDLAAVKVDGDDAIDAHGLQKARDVGGRDGYACLHLPILAGVSVVRDDDRDASGRCSVESGDHKEKLHEVLVDRRAGGLDDVAVPSSAERCDGTAIFFQ